MALVLYVVERVGAQSLDEETRRPPGTHSLDDDSMELRGRTADRDGTNNLDDGSLQGGDRPDPG